MDGVLILVIIGLGLISLSGSVGFILGAAMATNKYEDKAYEAICSRKGSR
ncbi:hypothetical protein [Paenibacillus agilis]|nr:hypothetical protein [Paenibacillus agilis]